MLQNWLFSFLPLERETGGEFVFQRQQHWLHWRLSTLISTKCIHNDGSVAEKLAIQSISSLVSKRPQSHPLRFFPIGECWKYRFSTISTGYIERLNERLTVVTRPRRYRGCGTNAYIGLTSVKCLIGEVTLTILEITLCCVLFTLILNYPKFYACFFR